MHFENIKNEEIKDNSRKLNKNFDSLAGETNKFSHDEIQLNISLLFQDDLESQMDSLNYFIIILKENDIILSFDYFVRVFELFKNIENDQLQFLILCFLQRASGFESIMQEYLEKLNVIEPLKQFWPNKRVMAVFGNLSISSNSFRKNLLDTGILKNIIDLLNLNSKDFKNIVNFINAICFPLKHFDFSPYAQDFISIFHYLHSIYNEANLQQSEYIIRAFSDYIDADNIFLDDFLNNSLINIFFQKDMNSPSQLTSNSIEEDIAAICVSLLDVHESDAANYLLKNSIISWIDQQMFSNSLQVLFNCYVLLYKLLKYAPSLASQYLENNFLRIFIARFHEEGKFKPKIVIYKILCLLFIDATEEQMVSLINEKVFDIIISNTLMLESEDDWPLILRSILKLELIPNNPSFLSALESIKTNNDFLDWFENDAVNSVNEVVQKDLESVSNFLLELS